MDYQDLNLDKNLTWTIDTDRGCFEGNNIEKIVAQMVEHYISNNYFVDDITEIYACIDGEILHQIYKEEINKIQRRIEKEVDEGNENIIYEMEGAQLIRADFFSNLI